MSNFRPSLSYRTENSIQDYRNTIRKREYVAESFDSYSKLKKRIREIAKEQNSYDKPIEGMIYVSRSRRGQWGEWFENWVVGNGKARIIKEGWM